MSTVMLKPAEVNANALQLTPESVGPIDQIFRLQANMRRGTGSNLHGTWTSYASIDHARNAAREVLRDDRVARVTVVTDTVPPRFVEWIDR